MIKTNTKKGAVSSRSVDLYFTIFLTSHYLLMLKATKKQICSIVFTGLLDESCFFNRVDLADFSLQAVNA